MSSSTSSSEAAAAGSWRRLWLAAAVASCALAALLGLALGVGSEALVAAGRAALSPPRDRLLLEVARPRREASLVLFLGDSTLRPRSYPEHLERWLPGVELRSLWAPGLGPGEHYLLLGRALALEPERVVLIAHLRMFVADGALWEPDLLTLLPPRELPRALPLPFHAHGVGAARLLLASAWGTFGSEWALEAFVGGQELARGAPLLRWLTPPRRILRDLSELQPRGERRRLYGDRLHTGHPDLILLGASVEQATRRGARVLVLVSPVPVHRFQEAGLLAPADFSARVALLRQVTERNGGALLDLHDALAPGEFEDALGHTTASGTRRIASALLPWLRDAPAAPR